MVGIDTVIYLTFLKLYFLTGIEKKWSGQIQSCPISSILQVLQFIAIILSAMLWEESQASDEVMMKDKDQLGQMA